LSGLKTGFVFIIKATLIYELHANVTNKIHSIPPLVLTRRLAEKREKSPYIRNLDIIEMNEQKGKLYAVATPIGNLDDLSTRALTVLSEVDFIACEDSRVTKKILFAFDLKKELVSFHQHSKIQKLDYIIDRLKNGESCALVTDAGTPGVSDPGAQLVEAAAREGIVILTVPGPSALTALLSLAGEFGGRFLFLGFPPHKKGRKKFFQEIVRAEYSTVIYESPHRILKALESLAEILPEADLVVGRELTKMHESVYRGKTAEIKKILESDKNNLRGEFAIMIKKYE